MKVSIVVAAYNERTTIDKALSGVAAADVCGAEKEIVIVESGSTDGTRQVAEAFVASYGAGGSCRLILQDGPRGKGNAVREGLANCSGDVVLIQDADDEYDFVDYPKVLRPILEGRADLVLGSRYLGRGWRIRSFEGQPLRAWYMNVGGVLFHGFFNFVYGCKLTDPTTMYKVFRRSCIEGLRFHSDRFDFDFELLAKLIRRGHYPIEVPVTYNPRGFAQGKSVRMISDPLSWIVAIVRFRFAR